MIKFTAILHTIGNSMIVQLPETASKELSSRGQVMVKGVINGYEFEKVLEPDGRWGHWFKLDTKLQKIMNVSTGDTLTLEIEPSKDWTEPDIPDDFAMALAAAPATVQALWTKITPMARWEWIRWFNATNNAETRERRVEVSISKMRSGKRRPCCFNLAACTDSDLAKNGKLIASTNIMAKI